MRFRGESGQKRKGEGERSHHDVHQVHHDSKTGQHVRKHSYLDEDKRRDEKKNNQCRDGGKAGCVIR